jgi:hypothetical protein
MSTLDENRRSFVIYREKALAAAAEYGEEITEETIRRYFVEFAQEHPNLCSAVDRIGEMRQGRKGPYA